MPVPVPPGKLTPPDAAWDGKPEAAAEGTPDGAAEGKPPAPPLYDGPAAPDSPFHCGAAAARAARVEMSVKVFIVAFVVLSSEVLDVVIGLPLRSGNESLGIWCPNERILLTE